MTPEQAFSDLIREGYLRDNGAGWHYVAKVPMVRDLPWFVRAIHTLSTWSVALPSTPARVEMSTGDRPDEIMFRMCAPDPRRKS